MLRDPGWLRPSLAFVLAVFGVLFRFVLPSRLGAFGLKRFRARPDEDIFLHVRGLLGNLLLLWAGWLLVQILVGMRESWRASVWSPLGIVAVLLPTSFARLYVLRHLPDQAAAVLGSGLRSWFWIALREAVPLGAILAPILVAQSLAAELPAEIPTAWDWRRGDLVWTDRDTALAILRHRTMLVYGVLLGLEGAYLIARWATGRAVDVGRVMLSRPLWLYYLFKTGWVLLFAGFNLALIGHARGEGSGLPALLPGLAVLSALGFLVAAGLRGSSGGSHRTADGG